MAFHKIIHSQFLPVGKEEAWAFFSSPGNLAKITPPEMRFQVREGADRSLFAGQIIQYNVSPLRGIPLTWVTEITHVDQGNYFIDEQRFCPFSFWHHRHEFIEKDGGVQMHDEVVYKLPLGIVGDWVHALWIRNRLEQIFVHRKKVTEGIFGRLND